jgi:hypothetical protein
MSHLRLSESKTQSVESIEESLRSFRLNKETEKENDDKENDETANDETETEKENDKTENDVSEIVTRTKKFLEVFFLSFWTVF